ncbi:MAG: alkaline phosphatase family protein [Chloroflexota bacterium]
MIRPSRGARRAVQLGVVGASLLAIAWFTGGSDTASSAIVGTLAHQAAPPPQPAVGKHRKADLPGPFAVILVIDAARADEVNLSNMPNLAKLAAQGVSFPNAWVGQLPSITESSHATIGTGVFPRRHLILGDTWRIPGTSQMSPNLLNSNLTRTGYIGKQIQQSGVPSLSTMVHQRFPGGLVVALSGHKIYAADGLGAGTADFVAFGSRDARGHYVPAAIPGHEPAQSIMQSAQLDLPQYPRVPGVEDQWTATLAEKFLFKYHPRLIMVNFPEVDVFGHTSGTNATVMQPLMAGVDRQIGRLVAAYGRAGMLAHTTWVVTADHGMVPALHTVNSQTIKSIITSAGGQPLYVGHGDYSTIWLKNLGAVPRVASALSNANVPNVVAVYAKDPAGQYRLISPISHLANPGVRRTYSSLLNTLNQGESPDIVLLYDENTITMTPNFAQIGRKGDHEGATWGAQHIPLYLMGPNVKHGVISNYPARLVDIAPTIETLMGITPHDQDGIPLADAMISPPADVLAIERKRQANLLPQVQALENEASLRPNLARR